MITPEDFKATLEANPIIAAIKNDAGLEAAITSTCPIIFILYGNLCNIGEIVDRLKQAGKIVFIHVDLLEGTSSKNIVVDFIKKASAADGIISAKVTLLKAAKVAGLLTIHRFFLIDSISYESLPKLAASSGADCVEIMPGYSKRGIRWVLEIIPEDQILIASGLVCRKEDIVNALSAGATAISTTNIEAWSEFY